MFGLRAPPSPRQVEWSGVEEGSNYDDGSERGSPPTNGGEGRGRASSLGGARGSTV